jgi:hypothetical protein
MAEAVNINDLLDGHVGLDLECLDRIYLDAYVPNLQVGGQVVRFLTEHLGNPIPSPVLFQRIGERFRREVARFAERDHIPLLHLKRPDRTRWDDRKLDHGRPDLERATRPGVVAIVAAQEFQKVFVGVNRSTKPGVACFDFPKVDRRVSVYYFYVLDPDFGAGFIKLCSDFPYPGKVWLNGHEWAKRQAPGPALASPPWPTGSPPAQTPPGCSRSATSSARRTCRGASIAGSLSSRPRSAPLTGPPGTGGSCRCAKSRCRAPSCSTSPAAPVPSSRR